MSSYKIPLLIAKPTEMKALNAYAKKIGAKLLVDEPGWVGFVKEVNENAVLVQYPLGYPVEEDAIPPGGVEVVPGQVAVVTEDNLDSKKEGIAALYIWAVNLDQAGYNSIEFEENQNQELVAMLQKI